MREDHNASSPFKICQAFETEPVIELSDHSPATKKSRIETDAEVERMVDIAPKQIVTSVCSDSDPMDVVATVTPVLKDAPVIALLAEVVERSNTTLSPLEPLEEPLGAYLTRTLQNLHSVVVPFADLLDEAYGVSVAPSSSSRTTGGTSSTSNSRDISEAPNQPSSLSADLNEPPTSASAPVGRPKSTKPARDDDLQVKKYGMLKKILFPSSYSSARPAEISLTGVASHIIQEALQ